MKFFYTTLFFITFSLYGIDRNSISKDREIWTDAEIDLYHQFKLVLGFGEVNKYLCLINASNYNYDNGIFSNLEDGNTSIGYKAILDNPSCGAVETNRPWIFKSQQASTESDLIIEMFSPGETLDTRAKLTVVEESSESNPYGILTMDYGLVTKPESFPLYGASYQSIKLNNNDIEFTTSIYVDEVIVNSSDFAAGDATEFYASKIIHTPDTGEANGTVTSMFFQNNLGAGFEYPGGNAVSVTTTNFAYDENYLKYSEINGLSNDTSSQRCINRSAYWNYVPVWGYGIYDSNGNRITVVNPIVVPYNGTIETSGENYTGNVVILSGAVIGGIPMVCKKVHDGTHYQGNEDCNGEISQFNPVPAQHLAYSLGGETYEHFPLFDIPDGTVLTDGTNDYYVRVLRPRKVYREEPMENCTSLSIQPSMDTPDHKNFTFWDLTIPKSGAVLVNGYSNDPDKDQSENGIFYSKLGDADSDGILNYLDAFPTDPQKSVDADYDGLDDLTDDNDVTQFIPNYDRKLNIELFSNYTK